MSILQEYEEIRRKLGDKEISMISAFLQENTQYLLSDVYYNEEVYNKYMAWKGENKMKTAYGYKLFKKGKDGKLYPLYVNANKSIPFGDWIFAECGERTEDGKVKSKLGKLAYRGGWHINDLCPYVVHIYGKQYNENGKEVEPHTGKRFDKVQKAENVWCLVEYETTVDQQEEANRKGINKQGKLIPKNAQLDMVDKHGFYRYKTNPNMFGAWIIAGNMRIVRELTEQEVIAKCAEYGLIPLPYEK